MNRIKRTCTIVLCCFLFPSGVCTAQTNEKSGQLIGVFEGRTPCQELARLLHEPSRPECIKIKWRLTLYSDTISKEKGAYELEGFVFRRDQKLKGQWSMLKGTGTDVGANIYQLEQPSNEPLLLQKIDDNILFFLDEHKNPMVGNSDFSYALNRVVKHL